MRLMQMMMRLMKANPDKCHFITSENKELVINVKYNITNSMNYKAMYTA